MCNFCKDFDFKMVGITDYDSVCRGATIYFRHPTAPLAEENRFKFCPACGAKLTEYNFKFKDER